MAAPRPASPPSAPDPGPVAIRALGADGDGLAETPAGPLFIAGTLPGETVRPGPLARRPPGWAADAEEILLPSPHRVVPPCPHFGPCGGCALQHLGDAAYASWKHGLVADTARRLGLPADQVPPLTRTPQAARRRIDLAIGRSSGRVVLGLHARRSSAIVDMHACPILHPTLFALVEALRPVLARLEGLRREGSAQMNLLDAGPDLLLRTDAPLTASDRALLTGLARAQSLPRIAWALGPRGLPETACQLRPATTAFSGQLTPIPPGAFLQASAEGELAIQAAVLQGLRDALPRLPAKARIAELFAGCGTLTHAIAGLARVQAYEGDADAVSALRAAANPRVIVTARDLARQPLQPAELKGAAAIVLDPPWAGAAAQMPALAASSVPIVYVSCNPQALLRDGRTLLAAGYRLAACTAIDQFLWSSRVEAVATFLHP